MKIQKYNAGPLTNFEVLEFLKSRESEGRAKDEPKDEDASKKFSKEFQRLMAPIAPSEYKVYDYLVETAASVQTQEIIHEFIEKCEPYRLEPYFLSKAEILNIINIRPSTSAQIYPIIEKPETRLGKNECEDRLEQLVEMVVEVLPDPPVASNGDEELEEEADAEEETAEEADANEEIAEEGDGDEKEMEES